MQTHNMLDWLKSNVGQTYGNFINGEWKPSASGKTYSIFNVAKHDQILGHFPESNLTDVDNAVHFAHVAFGRWSKTPGPQRASILYKFAELLIEHIDELAFMLSAEQGKVLGESIGEVKRAVNEVRFSAGEASRNVGMVLPSERSGVQCRVERYPLGVIAAIAPWNFPIVTPIRKIAPALAHGCTVVYKPATQTPWTSTLLMNLLKEAGVPNGVVNLVIGTGTDVGEPLVKHPLVCGITFTGSTKSGREINITAASRFVRTQLELGGKNPAIVMDYEDAGVVAREIVNAAFTCTGQRCTAISRVIVQSDKATELTRSILNEVEKLNVGPAWKIDANVGPLVNKSHRDSVLSYIETGRREGATLCIGGTILEGGIFDEGCYVSPTVFTDVTPDMTIAREEIFGPVLSIISVRDMNEAVEIANSVSYGLASSVFTQHLKTANALSEQIETGMVHINHGTASDANVPFGGVKQSGFGPYSIGNSNLEFFTSMKVVYNKS